MEGQYFNWGNGSQAEREAQRKFEEEMLMEQAYKTARGKNSSNSSNSSGGAAGGAGGGSIIHTVLANDEIVSTLDFLIWISNGDTVHWTNTTAYDWLSYSFNLAPIENPGAPSRVNNITGQLIGTSALMPLIEQSESNAYFLALNVTASDLAQYEFIGNITLVNNGDPSTLTLVEFVPLIPPH